MTPDDIEHLLTLAAVPEDKRQRARAELEWSAKPAQSLYQAGEQEGTPKVHNAALKQVDASARRLLAALDDLRAQGGYPWSRFWMSELFGPTYGGDIEKTHVLRVIEAIECSAQAAQIRRVGRPIALGKRKVVELALMLFRRISPVRPSSHEDNPFRQFARAFYEATVGPVGGDEEDDFFTQAIRAALNETS